MNIIKEICEKYGGNYSEEKKKSILTPVGKLSYQFRKGSFTIDNSKFEIKISENNGIATQTEPYILILEVSNPNIKELIIYPKTNFDRIFNFFKRKESIKIPKTVEKKYQFEGDFNLINCIVSEENFNNLILDDSISIKLKKESPNHLILIPNRGIDSLKKLESLIEILKLVKERINCD